MNWKYSDGARLFVHRDLPGGGIDSRSVEDAEVRLWIDSGNEPVPYTAPETTPLDLSRERYMLRAKAKDALLAEMNATSMELVRTGVWTDADLIGLMTDPQIKQAIDLINSLSFEFAASALMAVANPLMTPEIKAEWAAKLQAHFYLAE